MTGRAGAGRNRLVDTLTLTIALGGTLGLAGAAGMRASWWLVPYLVAVLFSSRAFCLGIHELGHLIAGGLAGRTWQLFKVGPLLVQREAGALRWSLDGHRRYQAAGLALTRPRSPELDTAGRRVAMLAGGPVASAALAAAAWMAWGAVQTPLLRVVVGVTALYSAIVLVTALLPYESAGNLSDGGSILAELRRGRPRRRGHGREVVT